MRYHYGDSLCVSTQVGCRMGCAFCASTLDGRVRDLTPGEMLGQVAAANRHIQAQDPVAARAQHRADGQRRAAGQLRQRRRLPPAGERSRGPEPLAARRVAVHVRAGAEDATAFADEGLPVTLSISLHAPNDDVRRQHHARRQRLSDRRGAVRRAATTSKRRGRRVVVEYALIRGVNCAPAQADELAARLRGLNCHVNLIPLNDVRERNLRAPSSATEVAAFLKRLRRARRSPPPCGARWARTSTARAASCAAGRCPKERTAEAPVLSGAPRTDRPPARAGASPWGGNHA